MISVADNQFPFGFPQQLKEHLSTSRRGLAHKKKPVVVLVHGKFHAKVMFPDGDIRVINRDEVWVEGIDPEDPKEPT